MCSNAIQSICVFTNAREDIFYLYFEGLRRKKRCTDRRGREAASFERGHAGRGHRGLRTPRCLSQAARQVSS